MADRMPSGAPAGVSSANAWTVTGILLAGWILAFIDRQIILILVPAIKASLGISDTQIGLLHGLAFSLFFSFAGLPMGRLVDRISRRNLLVLAIVGWSLSTIACGLAHSFTQLFVARVAVGVCQAVLAPASLSIVADLFSAERRGRPIALLIAAASVGSALSSIVVGVVLGLFTTRSPIVLPGFGALAPWQSTMIAIGLPGLVLAVVVALTPEPTRRSATGEGVDRVAEFAFLPYLRRHWVVFLLLFLAFACNDILGYGIASWFPALFMRSLGMAPAEAGLIVGGLTLATATVAGFGGGWISDQFARRDPGGGRLRLVCLCLMLEFIGLLPLFAPHSRLAVITAFTLFALLSTLIAGASYTMLPELVPNEGRGQVIAVHQLVGNLIGLGLGPTAVALVTDHVIRDETRLNLAMLIVGLPALAIGGLLAMLAVPKMRQLRAELAANTPSTEPV